jgi:hypothetical protein
VAGCGCGFVISANQTLTLHEITRANAGVAAGVYETGQRIGTALGIALASALFFGGLAKTCGDYHAAVGLGLASPAALVGGGLPHQPGGHPATGTPQRNHGRCRSCQVGIVDSESPSPSARCNRRISAQSSTLNTS